MRLQSYNHIAQVIAAIAVVVSLICVATKLRQNTRAMRLAAGKFWPFSACRFDELKFY